jgi:tRNA G18 (ribose-2'-O)-methylase SpoU
LHSVDLFELQPKFPVCVALGHEVVGLRTELLEIADTHVRIPMLGKKTSLKQLSQPVPLSGEGFLSLANIR